jgi:tRNA pseudouridine38-40 synthase
MEVSYKGTNYAGFQVQQNANTIQAEIERALEIYFKEPFQLTGSSRTDTGVHALQNFFHFDAEPGLTTDWDKPVYHLNAILPGDIVIKQVKAMDENAHCRFDAKYRTYEYSIYQSKNPFLADRAWYYPYAMDMGQLNQAAQAIKAFSNFESFSKRNSQVKTFECTIYESEWLKKEELIIFRVSGNRFLRGMVRGLVGTMLKLGRGKISQAEFINIIESRNASLVDFSVPPQGLILMAVQY